MFGNDRQSLSSRQLVAAVPARVNDVARLRVLLSAERLPVVTVIGKYNHGKSRLLNELIGHPSFSVADRRETVSLIEHAHDGICWLDAPGLDADVKVGDDDFALQAAWLASDIRLFVHAAKEGELDAAEREFLLLLRQDEERTGRQTLFVLSQIDQLTDDGQLRQVIEAIRAQVPGMALQAVSSARYRQGMDGGKRFLVENSGIPGLREALRIAVAKVPQAQAYERSQLFADIDQDLQRLRTRRHRLLDLLQRQQSQQKRQFTYDLHAVMERVANDMKEVLDVPGLDAALKPDSFQNMFKLTPGKRERNRLHVAYSKACIAISAVLAKHGVMDLPQAQQTSVRSLDNVIVAVMGINVKFREELRQIFCEPLGQARLRQAFSHYFEQSDEQQALTECLQDVQFDIQVAEQAIAALDSLKKDAA